MKLRIRRAAVQAALAYARAPSGAVALPVQPPSGWTELWVLRRAAGAWRIDVLTPAAAHPERGYVEAAGWSPDGTKLLVVREARVDRELRRRFEVLSTDTLAIEH